MAAKFQPGKHKGCFLYIYLFSFINVDNLIESWKPAYYHTTALLFLLFWAPPFIFKVFSNTSDESRVVALIATQTHGEKQATPANFFE